MTTDEIVDFVVSLGNVVAQRPVAGDGTPEIAWGDTFFFYSPDGTVPKAQPFATIVTKTYPGEPPSALDTPGSFRVNVAAGTDRFRRHLGHDPKTRQDLKEQTENTVIAHPSYGSLGWLAIINPATLDGDLRDLLVTAHARAQGRHERRSEI